MHRTLVIGGASPIGYDIAVQLKKQIRTCIQIIDDEDLYRHENQNWTTLQQFVELVDENYKCDLLILNLYDLLSEERYTKSKYRLNLVVFNKLFELIRTSENIKIVVIFNKEQYVDANYKKVNVLSQLNSFIIDYLTAYAHMKLNNIPLKIELCQQTILSDCYNEFFNYI